MEDTVVADRLIEIRHSIIKIVRHWEKLAKSKQPASKSFLKIQEAVNDKFAVAKFRFLSFVGSIFKPFLTKYQTSEVIEKCKTARDYKQIYLSIVSSPP